MYKRRIIFLTLILVIIFLLVSCNNIIEQEQNCAVPEGYGRVAVTIAGASTRTVFPTMAFEKTEYAFAKVNGTPGEQEIKSRENGFFILETGDWQVTVYAYAKETDDDPAAIGASDIFTVSEDEFAQVPVRLEAINKTGSEGTFSYNIDFPDGTKITVFSLENVLDSALIDLTPAAAETTGGAGIASAGTEENIPAGTYFLTIRLELDEEAAGANEVVYIYDKLDSVYSRSFELEDFISETDPHFIVDFEDKVWTGSKYEKRTVNWGGFSWVVSGIVSAGANDRRIDTKSVRFRGDKSDIDDNENRIELVDYLENGIKSISFDYASYGTHSKGAIVLYYQIEGEDWVEVTQITTIPSWIDGGEQMLNAQFDLNIAQSVRFKIVKLSASGSNSVNIDNIVVIY